MYIIDRWPLIQDIKRVGLGLEKQLVFGLTVLSFCVVLVFVQYSLFIVVSVQSGILLFRKKIKENNVPICDSFGSVTLLLDLL